MKVFWKWTIICSFMLQFLVTTFLCTHITKINCRPMPYMPFWLRLHFSYVVLHAIYDICIYFVGKSKNKNKTKKFAVKLATTKGNILVYHKYLHILYKAMGKLKKIIFKIPLGCDNCNLFAPMAKESGYKLALKLNLPKWGQKHDMLIFSKTPSIREMWLPYYNSIKL